MHPVIISHIKNDQTAALKQTSLDDILDTDLADAKARDSIFKARLSVVSTRPLINSTFKTDEITSLVKIQNTKTEAIRDVASAKDVPKKDEKYILAM